MKTEHEIVIDLVILVRRLARHAPYELQERALSYLRRYALDKYTSPMRVSRDGATTSPAEQRKE